MSTSQPSGSDHYLHLLWKGPAQTGQLLLWKSSSTNTDPGETVTPQQSPPPVLTVAERVSGPDGGEAGDFVTLLASSVMDWVLTHALHSLKGRGLDGRIVSYSKPHTTALQPKSTLSTCSLLSSQPISLPLL